MDTHSITLGHHRPVSILRRMILSCFTNLQLQPSSFFLSYVWYTRDITGVSTPAGISLICVHARKVGQLNFMVTCADGFVYTGCDSIYVLVWNKEEHIDGFNAMNGPVNALVVGPRCEIILSHYDGTIKVWKRKDITSPSYKKIVTLPTKVDRLFNKLCCRNDDSGSFNRHGAPISCLSLSNDMMFLYSGSLDYTIKVWRLRDWRLVETIRGYTNKTYFDKRYAGKVNAIATGCGDLMFSCSNDGSVRLFRRVKGRRRNIPRHQLVCVLLSGEIAVNALLFKLSTCGTGQLFAGLADGTLMFWQQRQKTDWKDPMTLSYHKKAVTCIAGLPRSLLVFSGSLDGVICLWKTERKYNDKPLIVLRPNQGSVHCLAVREDWERIPDGPPRLILYSNGEDGTIKIWRIAPHQLRNEHNFKIRVAKDGPSLPHPPTDGGTYKGTHQAVQYSCAPKFGAFFIHTFVTCFLFLFFYSSFNLTPSW